MLRKQDSLRIYVPGKLFEEFFSVLPTTGTILIVMSFFEKYSVNLDIKNHLVHFPNHTMSMQVRQQKSGWIILCSKFRTVIPLSTNWCQSEPVKGSFPNGYGSWKW